MSARSALLLPALLVALACTAADDKGAPARPADEKGAPAGIKVVVSERSNVPSRLPLKYAHLLDPASPRFLLDKKDVAPDGFLPMAFNVGWLDPETRTRENMVSFMAITPQGARPMLDDLAGLDPALVTKW
jgi:hypothetical protein